MRNNAGHIIKCWVAVSAIVDDYLHWCV